MNDPEEGKVFLKTIIDEKFDNLKSIYGIECEDDINNFKENKEFQTFIGSFVVEGDNLFLWRTYGKDRNKEEAKGISIGINRGYFDDISGHFEKLKDKELFCLYYVVYEGEENEKYVKLKYVLENIDSLIGKLLQKVRDNKEKEIIKTIIKSLLDEIRYLVKSKHYKEEKECRVVKVYNLKIHKNDKNKIGQKPYATKIICRDRERPKRVYQRNYTWPKIRKS